MTSAAAAALQQYTLTLYNRHTSHLFNYLTCPAVSHVFDSSAYLWLLQKELKVLKGDAVFFHTKMHHPCHDNVKETAHEL